MTERRRVEENQVEIRKEVMDVPTEMKEINELGMKEKKIKISGQDLGGERRK